jgi:predicted  nucleic acid-binding Zn-ribbon protein
VADRALESLLVVQGHDLNADQLRHRRASLPERTDLAEREAHVARLDDELSILGERVGELARSQKRFEDEIASIEARAAEEDTRLYSGSVTGVRELQSLQDEVAGLRRRARAMEDDLLDVLEALEPLQDEVSRLEDERDRLMAGVDELLGVIREAEAAIDGELAEVEAARAEAAADVPDDLLAMYGRLREKLGGIGVARLEGGRCQGCHLTLPATEVDAIRRAPEGAVVTHEECGRILVRP